MHRKLPVINTAGAAHQFVFANFGTLARLGWLPIALSFLAGIIIARIQFSMIFGDQDPLSSPALIMQPFTPMVFVFMLLGIVINVFMGAIFAVAIHRLILTDDTPPSGLFYLHFSDTEWKYALLTFAIMAPWAILYAAFFLIMPRGAHDPASAQTVSGMASLLSLAIFVLMFVYAVFVVRRLLAWPGVVKLGRIDTKMSNERMKGNFWRTIGLFLIAVAIPAWIATFVLTLLASSLGLIPALVAGNPMMGAPLTSGFVVYMALSVAINFWITAVGVAILSYAYKALVEGEGLGEQTE